MKQRSRCLRHQALPLLLLWLSAVEAHVRLDFPLARSYSLDFLDSVRTPPPCGMPKGEAKTSFEAGTSFNATWHLGYPHQGGYKLELLDQKGKLIQTLTPEDGGSKADGWLDTDTTAQRHLITLPEDKECLACTIRLLRTANEWSNSYRFWSCADIDIVSKGSLTDNRLCNNNGQHDKEKDVCVCDKFYFGDRCQYKDECETDDDCQNGGSCVDIDATTAPRKQCFCSAGYFGPACEKESSITERPKNLFDYETRQLNDDVALYWKILEDSKEIEVVMKGKTNTYMALGWRSRGTTESCQAFPFLTDKEIDEELDAESKSAEPEVEPEGKSAEPEVEPEGKSAEPESEPEGRSAEPESEPEGRSAEPEVEPEGRSAEPESEPEGEAKSRSEREVEPEPEGREAEPEVSADSKAEPEGRSEPEGEPEGRAAEPESEPEGHSRKSGPSKASVRSNLRHRYQPTNDKIHPMDCTDIVIGMARGDKSRIFDAYTRDRSTPMPDSFFGGKDDLTGALGYEEDGETTIVFRRKLEGSEETDHSIVNDLTHVIWAYGQKHGMYHHSPPSGLEKGDASIPDFYRPDEVKYHGKGNRGVVSMNFFEQTNPGVCMSSWRFPTDCEGNRCQYEASWIPSDDGTIEFTVRQKINKNNDDWIAIGFSHNTKMPETDIVAGFSNPDGSGIIRDFWASRYSAPELDASQDIIDASMRQENGFQVMSFKRRISTNDADKDISLEKDVHLVFPYSGGPMFGTDTIGKHKETPFVTDSKINLNRVCKEEKAVTKTEKLEEGAGALLKDLLHSDEPVAEVESEGVAEPKAFEEEDVAEEGTCQQGEWKYPEGCSEAECQYMAKWTKVGDNIKVSVQGKSDFSKDWIGIGFSSNPYMPRSDAVIGYVDEKGQGVVKDYWMSAYLPPDEDSNQDIKVLEVGKRDNVTFMKFLKKFSSDDKERDVDFNKDVYLLFPYAGGPVIAAGTIGQHRQTPEVSSDKINFSALCG